MKFVNNKKNYLDDKIGRREYYIFLSIDFLRGQLSAEHDGRKKYNNVNNEFVPTSPI